MLAADSTFQFRTQLSRQEMCIISQVISRDFSPHFFSSRLGRQTQMRFSAQELLEISRQISREFAPNKVSHQSRLVLLAVTPRRLHAYWHVAKRRLQAGANLTESDQPKILRVYTQPTPAVPAAELIHAEPRENSQESVGRNWFDINIPYSVGQQDILLPDNLTLATGGGFQAAIGKLNAEQIFCPLLYSNTIASSGPVRTFERILPPNAIMQFIMPVSDPASSAGKTASGQGNQTS